MHQRDAKRRLKVLGERGGPLGQRRLRLLNLRLVVRIATKSEQQGVAAQTAQVVTELLVLLDQRGQIVDLIHRDREELERIAQDGILGFERLDRGSLLRQCAQILLDSDIERLPL